MDNTSLRGWGRNPDYGRASDSQGLFCHNPRCPKPLPSLPFQQTTHRGFRPHSRAHERCVSQAGACDRSNEPQRAISASRASTSPPPRCERSPRNGCPQNSAQPRVEHASAPVAESDQSLIAHQQNRREPRAILHLAREAEPWFRAKPAIAGRSPRDHHRSIARSSADAPRHEPPECVH